MAKQVAPSQFNTVHAQLQAMKPQLEAALPKHLDPDRMLRVCLTAIRQTPRLLECDRQSLFGAIMTASQLGIEPDGVLGHGYLVPFASPRGLMCQFIPGYKGYIRLALNSGKVKEVAAHAVYENDRFDFEYGSNRFLSHKPALKDRGEIVAFYACANMTNGGFEMEVMPIEDVLEIRDSTQAYRAFKAGKIKSTPWNDNFVQMGRKTPIRRLSNYLPLEVQVAAAIEAAYDSGKGASLEGGQLMVWDPETGEVSEDTQPASTDALDAFAADAKVQGSETASASATASVLTASPPDAGPRDEELHDSSAADQGGDGQQQPLTQDEFDRLLNRMRSMAREQAEEWRETPRVKGSINRLSPAQKATFTEELQKLPWAAEQG